MTDPDHSRRLRQLLLALAVLLTFEGIARKAAPDFLRVPLFLFKDVLVVAMAYFVLQAPMAPRIKPFWNAYMTLFVLFIPCVLMTMWHDPLLAVYGAKQYLLYPMVGFATFLAFENSKWDDILVFFRWISLLIIPTAMLSVVQSHLPADHWLNMSVSGETLKGFSAGGQLRVSSTFSFVAQYCAFLNAEAFIVVIALHGWYKQNFLWKITGLSLLPLLVYSSFITGSRGAVVGNISIIVVAGILALMKFRVRTMIQIGVVVGVLYLAVMVMSHFFPDSIAAYSAREEGHLIGYSPEIRGRVFGSFFGVLRDKSMQTFLGNGLGVMSNGSDTISYYAAVWRAGLWTETDFSTTLFEGGYYLVMVWYGFRLYVMFETTRYFLRDITPELSVPMAFCQGFVIVIGMFGTLALQPPIAIWWWLGVGSSLLFSWKCIGPPESEEDKDEPAPPPPTRKIRGRSLYADVIHTRK